MKFYIVPEMKSKCEKALKRMFSKWVDKPTVTFHPVERKLRDYKHRIIEEAEFVIPSEIEDTDWDIVTENGNPFAVSADGIYKLEKA